ncbi:unnamed protein product [Durusdinium trenchii]|uniref:Uncharacterized protein n=2 Tax=Durusdinium trenchii TaxID=1381693 RepID=A0ABP0K7T7_9DINO
MIMAWNKAFGSRMSCGLDVAGRLRRGGLLRTSWRITKGGQCCHSDSVEGVSTTELLAKWSGRPFRWSSGSLPWLAFPGVIPLLPGKWHFGLCHERPTKAPCAEKTGTAAGLEAASPPSSSTLSFQQDERMDLGRRKQAGTVAARILQHPANSIRTGDEFISVIIPPAKDM